MTKAKSPRQWLSASGFVKGIRVDGSIAKVYPSFESVREFIGGHIEPVRLADGTVAVIDEEGLLKGLPVNYYAADLTGYDLVGPVAIIPKGLVRRVLG
jgi:hypothetical protein